MEQHTQREYLHPRFMEQEIERLGKVVSERTESCNDKTKELNRLERRREHVKEETRRVKMDLQILLELLKEFAKEHQQHRPSKLEQDFAEQKQDEKNEPQTRNRSRSEVDKLRAEAARLTSLSSLDPSVLDAHIGEAFNSLLHMSETPEQPSHTPPGTQTDP